ncbi:hypothetical protein PoB_006508200 [Plakobranchus ocellatus]|uniref:Uncharacterized protein n=1 Tax=Plakobranchus ocellatus TaxID=259542 RepID=A0AAV4D328_9GAST|nr:hypothetical protein PoB_006508200 [Plakobranchus ocellatus]
MKIKIGESWQETEPIRLLPNKGEKTPDLVQLRRHRVRDQSQPRGILIATCPRTTAMQRDKEAGGKEGWGRRRLTEPHRSRSFRRTNLFIYLMFSQL